MGRPSHTSKTAGNGLNRRRFLTAMAGGVGTAALGGAVRGREPSGKRRPNVLLLITDQQHAGMMSCAGNPHLKTPALDGLAANGTRFERAYAANPVCVPSRFSMMTGRMPSDVGMTCNSGLPGRKPVPQPILDQAMGHVFRRAGYETVYGGKTHWPRGMKVDTIGFAPLTPDQRAGLAAAAAAYLKRKHEKPFLLVASFINPHDICYMAIDAHAEATGSKRLYPHSKTERARLAEALQPPRGVAEDEFLAKHCPPLPANHGIPKREPECVDKLVNMRAFRRYVRDHWPAEAWRRHRWAYCRLTERVDGQIGRVLDALRDAGLEEETVVVFVSDHGDLDSAHRLEHKTALYEEACRVPFIVSLKGVTPPGRVDRTHLVSTGLDLLPTVCDFAGIIPPDGLHGRSVRPLAEGQKSVDWRDDLVVECQVGRMVRTDRYKYNVYEDGAHREQLIDLEKDPGEMVNLAEEPKHEEALKDHRRRLARWVDETGDPVARDYVVREA
jgi:choline-sulfatase